MRNKTLNCEMLSQVVINEEKKRVTPWRLIVHFMLVHDKQIFIDARIEKASKEISMNSKEICAFCGHQFEKFIN